MTTLQTTRVYVLGFSFEKIGNEMAYCVKIKGKKEFYFLKDIFMKLFINQEGTN
jgi:hypothetical protein